MVRIRAIPALGAVFLLAAFSGRPEPARSTDPRPQAGFVDVAPTADTDLVLEGLVARERYVEAFGHAVSKVVARLDALGPDQVLTLSSIRRAGVVAHLAGHQRLAEYGLETILPLLRRAGPAGRRELIETLIWRGYVARCQGERDRAAALYAEARALLRDGSPFDAPLEGFLEQMTADWTRGLDRARAIEHYETALRIRRSSPGVPWFSIADNATWNAWTLARENRWEEARAHVREARGILMRIGAGNHSLLSTLDELTAGDLALHDRWPESLEGIASSAERARRGRARFAPGVPRSQIPSDAFVTLAVDALRSGDGERAWELRERGAGMVHAELAWLGRADRVDPAAAATLRDLASRLLAATRDRERTPDVRALVRMLEAQVRLDEARDAFIDAHPVPQPTLEDVKRILDDRSALVGWAEIYVNDSGRGRTEPALSSHWGFVVRHGRPIRWVHLGDTRGAGEWRDWQSFGPGVRRMVRATEWPERVVADPEMVAGLADRAHRYFEPLRPYLDGVSRLVFEGAMHIAPEIFVNGDGRYLSDEFDIVHVPSAATLAILSDPAEPPRRATRSILAVAAGPSRPDLSSVDSIESRSSEAPPERSVRTAFLRRNVTLSDLPPLPFATVETASAAEIFPDAVRLEASRGNDTRLEALASSGELSRFDVVHLAGHALQDTTPEREGIVIGTDGLLTVEDVALAWKLGARLVTLSACEALWAGSSSRGEPHGFTPAVLAAGAPTVLSSAWAVDDRATAILMRRFYENVTGRHADERRGRRGLPMPLAAALAEAKAYVRELRDAAGARPFEHPSYWAGWMLIGTGD